MRLDEITRSVDTLPAMGGAALRVLALIEDAQASAARIEKALREDPGVTANLLRLANSAYFGIPSRIGSLRQAVSLLGLRRVTQMVVAACAAAVLQRPVEGYDLPAGELWRHSLAVSVAAEGLVRELGIGAGEEIFTAALLHDVGKIVLGRFVSEEMARIEAALGRGLTFEEAETAALGVDHPERDDGVAGEVETDRGGVAYAVAVGRERDRTYVDVRLPGPAPGRRGIGLPGC